jgi:hypothetical protein
MFAYHLTVPARRHSSCNIKMDFLATAAATGFSAGAIHQRQPRHA